MYSNQMVLYCCDCLFWLAHQVMELLQVSVTPANQSHGPHQGNSLCIAHVKRSITAACILTNLAALVGALDHENATSAMRSSAMRATRRCNNNVNT